MHPEPPDLTFSVNAMKGEVLASRGLALASVGRLDDARALRAQALAGTKAVEARVLGAAIEAVCAVNGRATGMLDSVERLLRNGV